MQPSLKLPEGWKLGTALTIANRPTGHDVHAVSLEQLIDSPVLCGAHLREVPIGPADGPRHFILVACESAEAGLESRSGVQGQV